MNTPDALMTWVLERDVFASGDPIRSAAVAVGQRVFDWSDTWWSDSMPPRMTGSVVFHGSLGNADRNAEDAPSKQAALDDDMHQLSGGPQAILSKTLWSLVPRSR